MKPLHAFIIAITFLIVLAVPYTTYNNVEAMCYEAMQRAITNTY